MCGGREGREGPWIPMHIVKVSKGICNKLVKATDSTLSKTEFGGQECKELSLLTLLQLFIFLSMNMKKAPSMYLGILSIPIPLSHIYIIFKFLIDPSYAIPHSLTPKYVFNIAAVVIILKHRMIWLLNRLYKLLFGLYHLKAKTFSWHTYFVWIKYF